MKVLVSGSHGLVGSELVSQFQKHGDVVARLIRTSGASYGADVFWDPSKGEIDKGRIEGYDAVIHLAGENLAEGRWTTAKKARIRDSRVKSTQLLADTLTKADRPPATFLCASAIGIYGHRSDEVLTEESLPGTGFLASVCKDWEGAAQRATSAGIRVVLLRFGVILSARSGALRKMLAPFQLGLGGAIGNGTQYWSWIALDDVVSAINHVLATQTIEGPVNFVSPQPVTNREFTQVLSQTLRRPTFFRVPRLAARLAFGQMAEETLLTSQRVTPAKLLNSGYNFQFAALDEMLRYALNR